jgi:hypothetical protein
LGKAFYGSFNNPLRYCGPFMWNLNTGNANANNGFRLANMKRHESEVGAA